MFAKPFFITASTTPPDQQPKPWFEITAAAGTADLKLRGYIGQATKAYDYWTGREYETGGAGTLQEFEAALTALGDVGLINLYLTSEGGDFPTAIAISSILARQNARIVCTIDGYAHSAAPVIACAADEIRAPSNALIMIHDAEFWCAGADEEALLQHIETLRACNASMIAAFIGKAGGTEAEWMKRIKDTTWMTGAQAKEIGLVDTLLDEVVLSAYQPLKGIVAARQAPPEILALIDKAAPSSAPTQTPTPTAMLRPRTPLMTAATDAPVAPGGAPAANQPPTAPAAAAPQAPAGQPLSLEGITAAFTTAMQPLADRLEKIEKAEAARADAAAHGIPGVTAAAPAPIATGGKSTEAAKTTSNLGAVSAAWAPAKK